MARKLSHKNKLHRRVAEIDHLRIYRVVHARSRCVIDATALVDPCNHRHHLKENPTLEERMADPEATNGRPLDHQYWLQEGKTGRLIGPCGAECGGRAVLGSWLKEKRDEMRQELLAKGVPANEIEDRLEQIAWQRWKEMLRIYNAAERDAKKLGINTTTLTYDEIVEAISWERRWRNFEGVLEEARREGITVVLGQTPAVSPPTGGSPYVSAEVAGMLCHTPEEARNALNAELDRQAQVRLAAVQATQKANQAAQANHVEFINWALGTLNGPNAQVLTYGVRSDLESTLYYINRGSAYGARLQRVEGYATAARSWPEPWTGQWPQAIQVATPPTAGVVTVPTCPTCGSPLVHRVGNSKYRNRPFDFYGCTRYPGCRGTMETAEYNRRMASLGGQQAVPTVTPPTPAQVIAGAPTAAVPGSKALAAAMAQAQQPVQVTVTPPTPATPKRRRGGYWGV